MKITGMAGTNNSASINAKVVNYVLRKLTEFETKYIDLKTLNIPMYSQDLEAANGIPSDIKSLFNDLSESDAAVVSVAEHNGNVTAFFKNITDWLSRVDRKYLPKTLLAISVSPGPGGAKSALSLFKINAQHTGAENITTFSLPEFFNNTNGDSNLEITNNEFRKELDDQIEVFKESLRIVETK